MRRVIWMLLAVVLIFTAGNALAAKEFDGVVLNVNSYGGEYDEVLKATIAKPLMDKYGIQVVYHPGTTLQAIAKIMAAKDNPPFDILQLDSPNMPTAVQAGLIEPVTEQQVPNLRHLYKEAREFGNHGVPFIFTPILLSWNGEKVKNPPVAITDLARPEFKGRAAIYNLEASSGVLTLLALAESAGGGVNNIQPGFAKLKELKPNLVSTPAASSALVQLFRQGEAWVFVEWMGRARNLQGQGLPVQVAVPKEGLYTTITYFAPVKGSKASAAVMKYLDQAISAEAALGWATKFFYPPTTQAVKLPPDLSKNLMLVGQENVAKVRKADWAVVSKNRGAWIEQWNKEMR